MDERSYFVHPTSAVDAGAVIGAGTTIWHFCHVYGGAQIGENCVVGQGCSIAGTVRIGNRVKLQNGISLYDGVLIEDEVFCGPHMIFTNVINPRAFIERKSEFKTTRVCRGATIGAGAIVLCGTTIGRYAFIGAGAVVTKDVKPFGLVYGNPARQHGWVGKCGSTLHLGPEGYAEGEDGRRYQLVNGSIVPEDEA